MLDRVQRFAFAFCMHQGRDAGQGRAERHNGLTGTRTGAISMRQGLRKGGLKAQLLLSAQGIALG